MILKRIELNNFGSYRFSNTFDISTDDGSKKIVIIGGKNGAGKTTLFTAIELALYGHYCFGYKNTSKQYMKKVAAFINDQAMLNDDETAYISIDFADSSHGDLDQYSITRTWTWVRRELKEHFVAVKNGTQLDGQDLLDFQNFLLVLIPPALLKLCFFDGERIAEYLLDDQKNNVRDALMVLSGNDTFDIMYNSVQKVLSASVSEEDTINQEYLRCKSALKKLRRIYECLESEIKTIRVQQDEASAELDRIKKDYASQGGISLDEWKALNTALKAEEEKRERISWERKAMAADILPFLIVQPLFDRIRPQIVKEHEFKTWKAVSSSIKTDAFFGAITDSLKKTGSHNADVIAASVYSDIIDFLIPTNGWREFKTLFGLSDDDETKVQAVLSRVSLFDRKRIANFKRRIDKSLQTTKEIREKLQNSSIENYPEYMEALATVNEQLYGFNYDIQSKNKELEQYRLQIAVAEKEFDTAHKALEQDIKRRSVSAVSSSVLLLLEDLQESVFNRLLQEVRKDTLNQFNRLIRKRSFIDDIEIDTDFRVHLLRKQIIEKRDIERIYHRSGVSGVKRSLKTFAYRDLRKLLNIVHDREFESALSSYPENEFELMMEIKKTNLSKGETQVFVMALYWALMQQCKCELPFIIDTPFARIDSEHRANIVEEFFKKLPGQLFILSTNEEVNSTHMASMAEQTANIFMLEYGDDKCTRIRENQYFEV